MDRCTPTGTLPPSIQGFKRSVTYRFALDAPHRGGYPRLVKPLQSLVFACIGLICIAGLPAQGASTTGTPTADKQASRIAARLGAEGISFERRPLFARYGGFGSSLHVDIQGKREGQGSLVLATSLTAPDINSEILLKLAETLHKTGSPIPVRIAFLADEEPALSGDLGGPSRLGLQELADRYEEKEQTAVIYLDLPEHPTVPAVEHGSLGTVAPLSLLEPFAACFKAHGYPVKIVLPYNELYRLKLIGGNEILGLLQGQGFPAFLLTGARTPVLHAEKSYRELSADSCAAILADWVAHLSEIDREMDRHYTFLTFGDTILPLSEWVSVGMFILLIALALGMLLIYSFTHRPLILARGKLFLIRSWVLVLYLALLFLCFYLSQGYLNLMTAIVGAPRFQVSYALASLKIILALGLFYVASHFITHWKIPRRSHYYSTAASVLFAIGLLVAAALDFSFIPVFLWAFLISLIAGVIHSRSLAYFLAILAPLPVAIAIAAAAGSGETGTAAIILQGGARLQLYIAFILQPFLFLFKRARTLVGKRPPRPRHRPLSRSLFLLGVLIASAVYLARSAGELSRTPPVLRVYEQERLEDLAVDLQSKLFLDRQNLEVTIDMKGNPKRLRLWFESEREILVFDAPMPLSWNADRTQCACTLGENPPQRLDLEFTLPRDFRGTLHAETIYLEHNARNARILTAKKEVGTPP